MKLSKIEEKIKTYIDDPDLSWIRKAHELSREAYRGQYRISGEPFVEHPLGVAYIMAELELDLTSIAAAILHDIIEDTEFSREDIAEEFNQEIALLVDGVTKLTRMDFKSREEQQAESLRKMFLAMSDDIRVVLIKLADRLHNMRTLGYMREEKQIEKARETLEIYAPLAHRLGMSRLKWELEDLSFRYLKPEMYYELSRKVAANRDERKKYIQQAIDQIEKALKENDIEADIYGRPKHLYSIYQKMEEKEISFEEVYDLTAVRVLVDSVRECYEVLGIIHEIWNPMPGRFKDYIAMPKSNMYQSLHTTVIGPHGDPLEVQIRTPEMHRTAEYGIAAHWRYKEGGSGEEDFEDKLSWLRQLLEWQKDLQEPHEFMEALKVDLFEDEVFVFTPKGDVINLPRGATPVDFAYYIHTEVGHNCVGAKSNGKMVPLEYELENGDIVEILTSSDSSPSRDWLEFVQSSRAKSKIKRWFKRQRKDKAKAQGKKSLNQAIERENIEIPSSEREGVLKEIAEDLNRKGVEALFEGIGYDQISIRQVLKKIPDDYKESEDLEELISDKKKDKRSSGRGIQVKGMDDILVRIAKCCKPVPGDRIVGYITRGRGVSVHRADCPNVKEMKGEDRFIEVNWSSSESDSYEVELMIEAVNKQALLNEITGVISNEKIELHSVMADTDKYNQAYIKIDVELSSKEHMKELMTKIENVSGVLSVSRARPS
ncbi:RelA/SpoT family protein [Halarsenatibacter silvermanii]|uniref:GTP diphosphokinase n=1 Tax=Halarsenatibacter silvermanii TaxID=321763 RepID=A0A1G9JQY5_9FIRM|nr:bifunctional (p)ppGpp synthetase/guanosine-3',5'-bis(diphosphate) 3'-pyrophosphohydrolase [Halarsenatibacter silvermanii]SDL39957.1 GTP pyrophosphokinase [Halarsenatibacter silvermanii]